MGLFRKQYHVDEAGDVVEGPEPGMRDVRELQREQAPTRWEQRRQERKEDREYYRKVRSEAKAARLESFREARIKRAREIGRKQGGTTFGDRLSNLAAGPPRTQTRKPVGSGYRIKNNYNPFGSMFDTGINYSSRRKSSGTKYKVIGGKAYPIAGTGKKKKKSRSSGGFGKYDVFDNWGFMK